MNSLGIAVKNTSLVIRMIITLFIFLSLESQGQQSPQVPDLIVNYDGKPLDGVARFKFVIHSGQIVLWSNDGSRTTVSEPEQSVELPVTAGIYKAELGTFPMKPLYYELLKTYPDVKLSTWVSIGTDFVHLCDNPINDQQILENVNDGIDSEAMQTSWTVPQLVSKTPVSKVDEMGKESREATNFNGWVKQWRLQHEDSDGKIPFNGLIKARRHIDNMPKPKDAGLWNWQWLGPGNIGGRIRTIAIKPTNANTIFIGSVSGGIWKSTNGGGSWSAVDDFMTNLAVTSIVYDPTNLNNMYASTGEAFFNSDGIPGAGIFKSTDGGTTWNQLASTNDTSFRWVNRLAHHPDSTGVLYAATNYPHAVWKTKDGGETWLQVFNSPQNVTDVKISPQHPQIVMAGSMFGAYRSANYGQTWDTLTNDDPDQLPRNCWRCEISFCQNNENRVYLTMEKGWGRTYRSDDMGVTWSLQSKGYNYMGISTDQGMYDQALWVDPVNSDVVIVGGIDLWKSTDGGVTFNQISDWADFHNGGTANSAHADQHIIVNHPGYNGTTNNIVYFGNDGGIQRADDISTVAQNSGWTNLAGTTLGITQFYGGAASPDGTVITGGAQDNDQLRYKSSGEWSGPGNWFQADTGDGGFSAIDYTNTAIQYSSYPHLIIEKSVDGGNTWVQKINGLSDANNDTNTLFTSPFVLDPNDANRLIAGSTSIWKTTDKAENWSRILGEVTGQTKCSAIDIAKGSSDIIWAGYGNGHVEVTFNGTAANPGWSRVDNNPTALPDRYITDIAINPNNSAEVYITFGGYKSDNVWFTADNGLHWTCRSGSAPNDLPALQVNSIRVHPRNSNWIYIGTDLGVFASQDKGQNWAVDPRFASQNNELPANVAVSELFWQDDYNLVAATYGRGMYRALTMPIIYVDQLAAPGGNGTFEAPFQTVTEAVNAAGTGTTISIKSNTYNEPPLNFSKKGRVKSTNGATRIK